MRLLKFNSFCHGLVLSVFWTAAANAQFTYPPPLERPLTDYTSGKVSSGLNFSEGDSMLGGWTTPRGLASFLLYRCVQTPSTERIYPSNSSFTTDLGQTAEDGTWEQMPLYVGFESAFGNGFNSGRNPIWYHAEFFAPNATTGDLCWFELYPGSDTQRYGSEGPERVATVNGAGPWYYATVPFTVKPRRPSGLTVLWKDDGTERGKPTGNSNSSQEFADEVNEDDADRDSFGCNNEQSLATSLLLVISSSLLTML